MTFNSFTIDGRIRQGYYSDEELETNRIEELSSWKTPASRSVTPDQRQKAAGELSDHSAALTGGK
ncbi:MAG: DUF5721 family protein [Clostridium sp.]